MAGTVLDMTHDERIRELVSAYIDGALSEDERQRVEAYLATSAELRQYYEELLLVREAVRSLPTPVMSRDLVSSILERTARENAGWKVSGASPASRLPSRERRAARMLFAGVAAAVAAVVLFSVWWLWQGTVPSPRRESSQPIAGVPKEGNSAGQGVAGGSASQIGQARDAIATSDARTADRPTNSSPSIGLPQAGPRSFDPARPEENSAIARTAPPAERAVESQSEPDAIPVVALVIDVVLTDKGVRERLLERALELCGIPTGQAIPVDAALERSLLAHRAFGAIGPEDLAAPGVEPPAREEYFQMMFLVATGHQYDAFLQALYDARGTGDVSLVRLDLASGSSDTALFSQLDRVVRRGEAQPDGRVTGVHPFVLTKQASDRLRDAFTAAQKKQGGPLPKLVPDSTDLQLPAIPANPQDIAEMERWLFKALVVVRSEASVRAGR